MSEIVYEVVCACTINRDGGPVNLKRGSKLKIDVDDHGFDERQFERAIRDGRLRALPLGEW